MRLPVFVATLLAFGAICWTGAAEAVPVGNLSVEAFFQHLAANPQDKYLVLFTDEECHESPNAPCEEMREYFVSAATKFVEPLMVPKNRAQSMECSDDASTCMAPSVALESSSVKFINVHDRFAKITNATKLEVIPRIIYYENGQVANVKGYHSNKIKRKDELLLQFVRRLLQPEVVEPHSEKELASFLFPLTEDLRSHNDEDSVTFILIEPEKGSFRSRAAFQAVARKYRARAFFARVRVSDGGDWIKALNLSTTPLTTPCVVRTETGRQPMILLNGLSEITAEKAVETTVERHRFPLIAEIGPNNIMDILENRREGLVVVGLYGTVAEKGILLNEIEAVLEDFSMDCSFATMNSTRYMDYLRAYLETGNEKYLVLEKHSGIFFLGSRDRMLHAYLTSILADEEPKLYERGSRALPRLIRKALLYRPVAFIGYVFGLLTLGALFIACTCGLRTNISGLDTSSYRRYIDTPSQTLPPQVPVQADAGVEVLKVSTQMQKPEDISSNSDVVDDTSKSDKKVEPEATDG